MRHACRCHVVQQLGKNAPPIRAAPGRGPRRNSSRRRRSERRDRWARSRPPAPQGARPRRAAPGRPARAQPDEGIGVVRGDRDRPLAQADRLGEHRGRRRPVGREVHLENQGVATTPASPARGPGRSPRGGAGRGRGTIRAGSWRRSSSPGPDPPGPVGLADRLEHWQVIVSDEVQYRIEDEVLALREDGRTALPVLAHRRMT